MEPSNDVSIAILRADVEDIRSDMKELKDATKELVEAWKAAGKLIVFIKWLAGVSTALAAAWIMLIHLFDKP